MYHIFINDIFKAIKNEAQVTLDDQNFFNALMYADDLIIIATTPEGLQKSLDGLSEYCKKWMLNVNVKNNKMYGFLQRLQCQKSQLQNKWTDSGKYQGI